RTKSVISRIPVAGPLAKRLYWKLRWRRAGPIMEQLRSLQTSTHLLLMESDAKKTGELPRFVSSMQRANGAYRIGIRDLPGGNVRAFQSIERQDYVVKSVVDWFDQTFPPAGSTEAPERLARARGTVRG